MASTDTQWIPVTGRHKVSIGSSLGRALKARKGIAPPKRAANLPDRDFYSFRYNFKPESIDPDKPGSIEVKRGKESTNVVVERPSTGAGQNHLFEGTEQLVKEYDCVLIYDEDLGTFTLEKIDSAINFTYVKRIPGSSSSIQRDTASLIPTIPRDANDDIDLEKELEESLVGLEDAEGEPEDDFEDVIATVISPQKPQLQRLEEEEEEDLLQAVAAPPPTVPAKPKPLRNKPELTSRPKPKLKGQSKAKVEPEIRPIVDSAFVEVLDFDLGTPSHQAKRPKIQKEVQKPASTQLALPDPSTSVILPSSRALPPAKEDSDSEVDWYRVVGGDPQADNDAEEIDLDAFEQEMAEQLEGSDDDILQAVMTSEPSAPPTGRPMSLNQFAGGQLSADEDSTSSSDDSDED